MEDENIYFKPGELVTLRLEIANKPVMIVEKKETSLIKGADGKAILKGIRCMWFDKNQEIHEFVFSTKDLIKL